MPTTSADLLEQIRSRTQRYLDSLPTRSVFPDALAVSALAKALDTNLPDDQTSAEEVLAFIDTLGTPATVASASGRYFGFVTGGSLPAAMAAHNLATAWDQNSFSHVSSPAAALFEEAALRWLKEALDLPRSAEGAFVTGATMANFTCLAAARHQVLAYAGWDLQTQGLRNSPGITIVVGEEVHATIYKVLGLLGFGTKDILTVPADEQGRMRVDAIPSISGPTIICVQAGNVNSGAFDAVGEVAARTHADGAWVHVDGAFGLWARATPALAHVGKGLDAADSWATDAHKWLNVPYDCGVAVVRNTAALRQAMSISGAYLLQGDTRGDAIDVTPDSSRRARAVDVWAAFKSLGRAGLAALIERNCTQAKTLASGLREASAVVLNEVILNQVVARFDDDTMTAQVLRHVQDGGECWCGGTVWQGQQAIRISVSSWATSDEDIERALVAFREAVRAVRAARQPPGN